jgi:iron complex transport system substrate-binding protein
VHRTVRPLAAVAVAAALLAACGDDSGSDAEPETTEAPAEATFPASVEAANGTVTLDARPERIVSLSPTATENLFAVGAGDQVEAVDSQSDYPDGVPTTDLSGLEPNVEALLGYEPDLVVIDNPNDEVESALADLDIPVLVQPAAVTFDDVYDQIGEVGTLTGHVEESEAVVEDLRTEIDDLAASVPESEEALTYYHELDDTYYSATSSTFIGQVYDLAGLTNIADEADDGSGYPQLSAEYIIDADPDLVFLADTECCGQSAATVADRPGWDQMAAVQGDGVVELDDDVVSRWGPRVADFLAVVVDAVERVSPA